MRKHSKVILLAEEQLVFGHSLPEMVVARDNLRSVVPESLLLDLLELADRAEKSGTPTACKPMGLVS